MNFDGAGNTMTTSKNDNITSAGRDHTINAGAKATINAGENYATSVGKDASCLHMDADGNILLEGKAR